MGQRSKTTAKAGFSVFIIYYSSWVVVDRCGSLWIVVGSLWVVVDRCGSLWIVVGRSGF